MAHRRIGLLGGTFDPPHIGHLWLAETAREQLNLETVFFLPVGHPPHKPGRQITAVHHRLNMVRQAIQGHEQFLLDDRDVHRPPPHTTATLLPHIKADYPQARLWWLVGSDSLRDFPDWSEPADIIRHCRLGVLPRPGVRVDEAALETAVPGIGQSVDYLAGPRVALSSTDIRRWCAAARSVRYLVPAAVWAYLQAHALYR